MPARIKTSYPGVYYYEAARIGGTGTEKVFYVIFKKHGKVHEEKAGRRYADNMTAAKASRYRAARIEGKVKSRKQQRQEAQAKKEAEANKWTMDRLWAHYTEQKPESHTLHTDDGRYQKHLSPALGKREPAELLTLDVDRLRVRMLKTHSPQTVKHVLALIKRIIRHGVSSGLVDPPSPRQFSIKMPLFDNQKTETLTDDQLARLLQAAREDTNQQAGALVQLALATGMRRSEMLRLQWQDVDHDAGFITLPRTKSGKVQRVPINDMAREVLDGLPTDSEYCFPGQDGKGHAKGLYPALRRIREKAGLPESIRPLHSLRHVYASRLASSGESLYVVQKLLRHSDQRMTQRYSHLADEPLRAASDKAGKIMSSAGKARNVLNLDEYR